MQRPSQQHTLISTKPPGRLDFPIIVTEVDGAALSSLTVCSHSELPLVVKLDSSQPSAVSFQLENENLRCAVDDDDDPEDWNQLFNEVGHVSSITLPPHGEVTIVVSFRPTHPATDAESSHDPHGRDQRSYAEAASFGERHAIHVNPAEERARLEMQQRRSAGVCTAHPLCKAHDKAPTAAPAAAPSLAPAAAAPRQTRPCARGGRRRPRRDSLRRSTLSASLSTPARYL